MARYLLNHCFCRPCPSCFLSLILFHHCSLHYSHVHFPYLAMGWPHLEFWGQFWPPHYQRDIKLLEGMQRRDIKMMKSLEGMYKEQLRSLCVISLAKRRLRGDLKAV